MGGADVAGARAAGFAAAALSTSSLVMRPSLPVPLMFAGSMPFSSTARRTAGESVTGSLLAGSGAAVGFAAGAGAGTAAAAPDPASTVVISAPTFTVSPSFTRCAPITPATGDITSIATLSVSRLAMGSSTATASPGCLSHWPIEASETDSPSTGTLTSTVMAFPQAFFWRRISERTDSPNASATSAPCSDW